MTKILLDEEPFNREDCPFATEKGCMFCQQRVEEYAPCEHGYYDSVYFRFDSCRWCTVKKTTVEEKTIQENVPVQ